MPKLVVLLGQLVLVGTVLFVSSMFTVLYLYLLSPFNKSIDKPAGSQARPAEKEQMCNEHTGDESGSNDQPAGS